MERNGGGGGIKIPDVSSHFWKEAGLPHDVENFSSRAFIPLQIFCQLFLHVIWRCRGNRILICRLSQNWSFWKKKFFVFPVFSSNIANWYFFSVMMKLQIVIQLFAIYPFWCVTCFSETLWHCLERRICQAVQSKFCLFGQNSFVFFFFFSWTTLQN